MRLRSAGAPRLVLGVFGAGVLAFGGLFVAVGLERADQYGSVIGALTAFAALGVALWDQWAARSQAPQDALDAAAARLAEEVGAQWRREAQVRRLLRPAQLRVRWSTTRRPVQAAGPAHDYRRSGQSDRLAANFRAGPARQLVVLGEPGAGKSTLAVLLVLDLLENPRPGEPVPVLLSLSSWDPRVDLHAWMAERLLQDHRFLADTHAYGPDIATRLIAQGRVLPVLDGLDEVAVGRRATAIEAIEHTLAGAPLVLTCRGEEYQEIVAASGTRISDAPVIELEPVGLDPAIEFLEKVDGPAGERWRPLFEHLRAEPGGALARALSTPLMIDLLRTAYARAETDPAELTDPDRFGERGLIEDHLLDTLIPTLYPSSPVLARLSGRPRRYRVDRVRRWLTHVARHLRSQNTRDFALWRLRSPVVALVSGAAIGAGGWLLGAILFGSGALQGPVCGLAVGITAAVAAMTPSKNVTARDLTGADPRSVLRRHLVGSGLLSVLAGTVVGLVLFVAAGGLTGDSVRARLLAVAFAGLFGLGTAVSSSWGAYLTSRAWLALTGRLPFRLKAFLDDAHERGVLRRAGAVYQFRHARLQDRLAGPLPEPDPDDEHEIRLGWLSASLLRIAVPVAAVLVTMGLFVIIGSKAGMEPSGGYRPAFVAEQNQDMCPGDNNTCGVAETSFTWKVPAGTRLESRFAVQKDDDPIALSGLGGRFALEGCSKAAVDIRLSVGGRTTPPAHVALGPPGEKPPTLSGSWPQGTRSFTLTVRRTDGRPCDADLVWKNPTLTRDLMSYLKRNLRGEPS